MSKMKQIAVLTAMLVGVIMYASPAKSAVCFLPDDDGSCGGGDIEISDGSDSDDNKPEEKCEDFPVSETEYKQMKNCFDFTYCTKSKTNEVKYKKGAQKENTTWSNEICCTNGETYDSAEGQCCPAGGCTHECDAPKEWSTTLSSCECPKDREENTNHECCPVGEHADGAICCPEKKHNDGGVCKCDSQYNTDDDGNCIPQNNIKTTITVQYSLNMSRQGSSSWLNLTFKVLSASDAKSHHVELTFNPMDGAEPTNCTISYPLTFGTNTKTKVQCGSVYSMMNTPKLTNVSVDNSNVAASIRLDQLDNSTVQNDKYVIKLTKAAVTCPTGYKRGDITCASGYNRVEDSNISGCYKCEKVKQTIPITVTDNIDPLNGYGCNSSSADPSRCSKYRFTRYVSFVANSTVIGNKGKLKVSYDRSDPYDGDVSFEVNTQNSFSTSFDFDCERSITAMGNYCLNLQEFNIRIEGVLNTYKTRKTCEEKTLEIHGKTFNIKCEGNASLYYNNYK